MAKNKRRARTSGKVKTKPAKRAKAPYNREARKRAQRTVRRLGAPEDCPVCLKPLARKKDSPVCLVPCGVSAMPSTWNGSEGTIGSVVDDGKESGDGE